MSVSVKPETERSLLLQAEAAIRTCLADIPFSKIDEIVVERGNDDDRRDIEISARFGKLRKRLIVEAKSSGQPRIARQAATNLRLLRQSSPSIYGIFAAPFITPETGEQLAEQDIGYVDFAGNCRLCFDSVYIRREGQVNRFTEKRDLRTLYSPPARACCVCCWAIPSALGRFRNWRPPPASAWAWPQTSKVCWRRANGWRLARAA